MSGIDQYAKLVIHAEGVNDGTVFTDSSITGHSITASGVANTSSDQKKFGNTSLELSGTGQLSIPHSDEFNFNTADWTIDFWVYNSSDCARTVLSKKTGSRGWEVNLGPASGGSCLCTFDGYDNNQAAALIFYAYIPASTGEWYHIALMKSGTQYKIYHNGIYYPPTVNTNTGVSIDNTYSLLVGNGLFNYAFNGFIDELRLSMGIARWASMFTMPTAAFLNDTGTSLLFHFDGSNNSATFTEETGKSVTRVDDMRLTTSYKKFGTASAYFDGTYDYFYLSDSADFNLGSEDFDIAVWLYPTILTGDWRGIVVQRTEYNSNHAFGLWQNYDYVTFEYSLDGTTPITVNFTEKKLTINSWNFVAISRRGTRLYCNVNGFTQIATISSSAFYDSTANLLVGFAYNRSTKYKGYMDELKILKGSSVFADEFTPYDAAYTQIIAVVVPEIIHTNSLEVTPAVTNLPAYALEAATSESDPFLITYSGTLYSDSAPIWKLFDHAPTQYESSQDAWGDGASVWNTETTSDPFRAVLINLGLGNEKCFNKFRYCASKEAQDYYKTVNLRIQATNTNCSVIDPLDDAKWVNLFNDAVSFIGSYNAYGAWQVPIILPNTESYRYYRIIPEDEYGQGSWIATEFLFYERIAAANDVSVYVPGIVTTEELSLTTRIVISEITIPEILLQQTIEMELYAQVLGIDEHTVLMLHMDGPNESQNFIDSSIYEQEVTIVGLDDRHPSIWETGGDPDSFLGCGLFNGISLGIYEYFTFQNIEALDLGLNNTPFCIDFRMYVSFTYVTDPIIFMRGDDTNGVFYQVQLFREDQRIKFLFKTPTGTAYIEWAGVSWSAWHHFAITYDGTTTRLFVDGVSRGTPVTDDYVKPTTCTLTCLGNNTTPALGTMFIGRLDEFRISKGVPRWTSNFLVPVDPYELFTFDRTIQVPTSLLTHEVSVGKINILPSPIPVPDILTTESLSIAGIFMGFKLPIPDITLTASGEFSLQINVTFSVQLTHTLTTRVFGTAPPLLAVPEIVCTEEMTVVDVFLGSKIQVPDIVTTEQFEVQYNPGWYNVDYGVIRKTGMTFVADDLGEVLFGVVNAYTTKFAISVNSGRDWEEVFPLELPNSSTPEIRISGNGQVLLVCALIYTEESDMNLVQISLDRGQTWSKITSQIFYNTPISLQPDKGIVNLSYDGSIIYFGHRKLTDVSKCYMYKSVNYGETWTELFPLGNSVSTASDWALEINSSGSAVLLLSRILNTAYYSEDYGQTWYPFDLDYFSMSLSSDSKHFVNSTGSILLLNGTEALPTSERHYFISVDHGGTWDEILPPVSLVVGGDNENARWDWWLSISDDGQIGLATIEQGHCYLSTDGCQSWELTNPAGGENQSWDDNTSIVSSDGYWLYVSKDFGQIYGTYIDNLTWRLLNPFTESNVSSLVFGMNQDGNSLVACTVGYLAYQSTLKGLMWWPIFGDGWQVGWSNAALSDDGSKILIGANVPFNGGILLLSEDYGENWKSWNPFMNLNVPGEGFEISSIAFMMCGMSGDGNVLLAGLVDKEKFTPTLYKSVDSGDTWNNQTVLNPNSSWDDCSLNYDGSVILIADGDFLIRFYSGAWTKKYPGGISSSRNWCCAVNSTGAIMLAGNDAPGRLYKSTNYGETWAEVRPDGDVDKYWTTCSMSADGAVMLAGTYKYSATEDGQLFKSEDYGVSWTEQKMSTRIEDIYYGFTDSAVSADGSILYAGDVGLWTNRPLLNETVTLQKSIPSVNTVESLESSVVLNLINRIEELLNESLSVRADITLWANGYFEYLIDEYINMDSETSGQLCLIVGSFLSSLDNIVVNWNGYSNINETLNIYDSIKLQFIKILYDTFEIVDSTSADLSLLIAEFIAVTESVIPNWNTTRSISENLSMVDSIVSQLYLTITESLELTESQSEQLSIFILDFLQVYDSIVLNSNTTRIVSDSIYISDSIIQQISLYLTESLELTDAQGAQIQLVVSEFMAVIDTLVLNSNTTRTVSETLEILDSFGDVLQLFITEYLDLSDEQSAQLQLIVHEFISCLEVITPNWNTTRSLTESLNILDSIYQQLLIIVTESLTITDSAPISQLGLAIYEYLGFTESLLSSGMFYNSLSESIHNTDILNIGYAEFITDIFSLVDTSDTVRLLLNSILDTFTLSETAAGQLKSIIPITDSITLIDTISNSGLIYNTVRDAISLNITIELDNDIWECYVLNTPKFFPSIYSGFSFNSYCVFQNRAYGAKIDGIYELSGSTDNGIVINTGVLLSETTFNLPNQKRFRKAYLGVSGTTPLLIAETEAGKSITYIIDSAGEADMSRLLKSKKWKLTVSDFSTLDFIKLIPVILAK